MTSTPGATIYYRAVSDTTTDISTAIDPNDNTTYTATGTSVTPATFGPGDVYRIKAMAVLADERRTPETAIQRFDYDIDSDNDGLIEIRNLEMFNNIRFNLAGTTYDDEDADTGTGDPGITTGGPTTATTACTTDPDGDTVFLCGYELMGDLDFAQESSYASGTVNATWCPDTSNNCIGSTSEAGFPGIGAATGDTDGFTAIFDGNGNSISNFYSRKITDITRTSIGLFAFNESGTIRNIAVEANLFGGQRRDNIGGLVGRNTGTIIAGSASSNAEGGSGGDRVGGLVGYNHTLTIGIDTYTGTIIASSASGSGDGGEGGGDRVGGLVGLNEGGTVIASYATGSAAGGVGNNDRVGGLAGENNNGNITASYAIDNADGTNNAAGGDGNQDRVGGLVGENNNGTITASYATISADGGDGDTDYVGGLVGENNNSTITASYAIGDANGGGGFNDNIGGLVGTNVGAITESYGFGDRVGDVPRDDTHPGGITAASGLTADNVGDLALVEFCIRHRCRCLELRWHHREPRSGLQRL